MTQNVMLFIQQETKLSYLVWSHLLCSEIRDLLLKGLLLEEGAGMEKRHKRECLEPKDLVIPVQQYLYYFLMFF